MSSILCNVATGIIEIIFPETSPTFTGQYLAAMKSVGAKSALLKSDEFYPKQKWIKLLKVCYVPLLCTEIIQTKTHQRWKEVGSQERPVFLLGYSVVVCSRFQRRLRRLGQRYMNFQRICKYFEIFYTQVGYITFLARDQTVTSKGIQKISFQLSANQAVHYILVILRSFYATVFIFYPIRQSSNFFF